MQSLLPDDSDLLVRIRSRDQAAMAALFDRYSTLIYSIALRVVRSPHDAEDIMQEVLLRFWVDPSKFDPERGALGSWFAVVARNQALTNLRKTHPLTSIDELPVCAKSDPFKEVEHCILRDRVYASLEHLPIEQKTALLMVYRNDLTHSEIARLTGQPLGTVKSRIRSGLISLRASVRDRVAVAPAY